MRYYLLLPTISSNLYQKPLWHYPELGQIISSGTTSAKKELVKSLKYFSEKFEEFRTRWYNEYLLSLRETGRDLYQVSWNNLIKKNDVVFIKSPVKERPYWQMGIVVDLIIGDDNKVRSVYVRTPGGQVSLYPVSNICIP